MTQIDRNVIVIGGGPNGIACAVHLLHAGLTVTVLERGGSTDNLRRYPDAMRFSSTRERMTIPGFPFDAPAGVRWDTWPGAWPADANPTRDEAVAYYREVAAAAGVDLRERHRVRSLDALRGGGFRVVVQATGTRTAEATYIARFVVVATGSFDTAAELGVPGEDLPHVSHYFGRGQDYAGQRVVVVGGTSSALETALVCLHHGAAVTIVHRREGLYASPTFHSPPRETVRELVAAGQLQALMGAQVTDIGSAAVRVRPVHPSMLAVRIPPMNTSQAVPDPTGPIGTLAPEHTVIRLSKPLAREQTLPADAVLLMTGYRPDRTLLRSAGVAFNAAGEPAWDRDTCESNVRALYIVGAAGNPEGTGNRTGITSGLPQAARAMAALAHAAAAGTAGCALGQTALVTPVAH